MHARANRTRNAPVNTTATISGASRLDTTTIYVAIGNRAAQPESARAGPKAERSTTAASDQSHRSIGFAAASTVS
jgi:hypothetical protein